MTQLPGKPNNQEALRIGAEVIANHIQAPDPHGDRAASEEFAVAADAVVLASAETFATAASAGVLAAAEAYTDTGVAAAEAFATAADSVVAAAAAAALAAHVVAVDPHGDRAFATAADSVVLSSADAFATAADFTVAANAAAALAAHVVASDPHGDRAFATAADVTVLSTAEAYADTGDALLVPKTRAITAGTGLTGGGNLTADRTLTVAYGTSGTTACVGNDSRLSDSRTPTAHATSHVTGGSDVIANAVASGASGLLSGTDKATINGLGTISTQAANNVSITGGSITGITDLAIADGGTGSSTAATARTALGSTTVGDAVFIAATTAAARTAMGLAAIAASGSASDLSSGTVPLARLSGITTNELSNSALINLTQLASIAATTLLGNNTAGGSVPLALTTSQVKTQLGLVVGTDVQAYHATLQSLSGVSSGADLLPYFSGGSTFSSSAYTAVARTLVAQTTQALMRTTGLGLTTVGDAVASAATALAARSAIGSVIGTDVQAFNANLSALAGLSLASSTIPVATGSGAMALDDWDRTSTSWTPVVEGAGTAGTNNYDIQVGRAIRRGKLVSAFFRLHATSKGTAMVGNVQIGGLPYTSVNTTNYFGPAIISSAEGMVYTTFASGLITANTSKLLLYKNTSGTGGATTNITTTDLGSVFGFIGVVFYEAA